MRYRITEILLLLALCGCSVSPYKHTEYKSIELSQINNAYSNAVNLTKSDNSRKWRNGVAGNIWINTFGGQNYGLCYQWQNHVYKETLSTIQGIGWTSGGIVINKGTDWEHHAVIVYDPKIIKKDTILANQSSDQIFVLDPWHTGKADIYTLENWLKIPMFVTVPMSREDIEL